MINPPSFAPSTSCCEVVTSRGGNSSSNDAFSSRTDTADEVKHRSFIRRCRAGWSRSVVDRAAQHSSSCQDEQVNKLRERERDQRQVPCVLSNISEHVEEEQAAGRPRGSDSTRLGKHTPRMRKHHVTPLPPIFPLLRWENQPERPDLQPEASVNL